MKSLRDSLLNCLGKSLLTVVDLYVVSKSCDSLISHQRLLTNERLPFEVYFSKAY